MSVNIGSLIPAWINRLASNHHWVKLVKLSFRIGVCLYGVVDIIKPSQILLLSGPLNVCLPFISKLAPRHSCMTRLVVSLDSLVLKIVRCAFAITKVFDPVVRPNSIDMVNLRRNMRVVENPNHLVLRESALMELTDSVTVGVSRAPSLPNDYPFGTRLPVEASIPILKPLRDSLLPFGGSNVMLVHGIGCSTLKRGLQ